MRIHTKNDNKFATVQNTILKQIAQNERIWLKNILIFQTDNIHVVEKFLWRKHVITDVSY